jgi:carboxylate-amine ligase
MVAMGSVPTFGVEEELLLVDPETGAPRGRSEPVREEAAREEARGEGASLDGEMRTEQVETASKPHDAADALAADLRDRRARARDAARTAGVDVVALPTSPVAADPDHGEGMVPGGRYGEIAERFGPIASAQLTSGQHTHVAVNSSEEGVGVLDRIGPWLPVLRAVSANSPFWRGNDTGYASYRSVVWARWPSAGPTRVFGSLEAHDAVVAAMLETATLLDEKMVYFDARLAKSLGTVEIRVADVATELDDAVLVAVLARALVMTAAESWRRDEPALDHPVEALRLAHWGAARWGLSGDLVDPTTGRPRPAGDVLAALRHHVRTALDATGDTALVDDGLARLTTNGSGAERQRAAARAAEGDVGAVVADAVRRTHAD